MIPSLYQSTSLALWLLVGLVTGDTSKKSRDGEKEWSEYMALEWRFKPVMAKEKGDDMATLCNHQRRRRGSVKKLLTRVYGYIHKCQGKIRCGAET